MPTPAPPRPGDRIAKLLARAGIASRREVERMIADGRVALDGVAIGTPATVLTSLDGITVDGKPVAAPAATRLFVYHKPVGLLVTERDPAGRPTIYDRLPEGLPRVVPVGRLDLATEGLLLLTTDGGLKRQLELPATGVERTYRARAYGPISQERLEELIEGIEIDGMRYGPIDANLERRTGANTWIELTLTEGKNREVRRVLEHLGLEVSRLIRTRYGPFVLGDMAPGDVGEIRQHDLEGFRKTLKGGGGKAASAAASVMAEPLAKPTPAVPAPVAERARASTRPVRREGSERRVPKGPPSRANASPTRDRPVGADERRGGRPAPAGASARPPRTADTRDERPRAFGDRTRAAAAARTMHPRAEDGERARRGAGRNDAADQRSRDDRETPRADRSARPTRSNTATQRPTSMRPTGDRSPSPDRSRGPAGGRGKPQDPRRPKAPPRGKR